MADGMGGVLLHTMRSRLKDSETSSEQSLDFLNRFIKKEKLSLEPIAIYDVLDKPSPVAANNKSYMLYP